MILPAPALTESLTFEGSATTAQMTDLLQQTAALGNNNGNNTDQTVSPPSSSELLNDGLLSSTSQPSSPTSLTTPPHPPVGSSNSSQHQSSQQQQQQQQIKYRILTIHLEKEKEGLDWAIPVSGGHKAGEMDMDVTSAYLLAGWHETRMGNLKVKGKTSKGMNTNGSIE
jgi:hypothetical protein